MCGGLVLPQLSQTLADEGFLLLRTSVYPNGNILLPARYHDFLHVSARNVRLSRPDAAHFPALLLERVYRPIESIRERGLCVRRSNRLPRLVYATQFSILEMNASQDIPAQGGLLRNDP